MSLTDEWKEFIKGHGTAEEFIVGKETVEKVIEELLNNLSGEKLNFRTKIKKSDVRYNHYFSIPTEYEEILGNFYYVERMFEAVISNYKSMEKIIRDCGNIRNITKMYGLRISIDNDILDEENLSELEKKLKNTGDMFKSKVLKEMMELTKDKFVEALKKGNPFYLELGRGDEMKLLSITYQRRENAFEITIYYNNFSSLKEGASWTKGKILHDLGGMVKILQEDNNEYTTKNT